MVRRTATSKGETSVGRSLPVDDETASVVEGESLFPSQLRPPVIFEGLGRDHERVDRGKLSSCAWQGRGETFGGSHDDVGGDGTAGGAYPVRGIPGERNIVHCRVVVDRGPQRFHDVGQAVHEAGRMNRCAMRRVETSKHIFGLRQAGISRVDHAHVEFGEPELVPRRHLGSNAVEMGPPTLTAAHRRRQSLTSGRARTTMIR